MKQIEELLKYSKELEANRPDKNAYWHLQRLREKMNEALNIQNVSNQRELLIAFGLKVATQCTKDGNWTVDIKEFAKEFESNL